MKTATKLMADAKRACEKIAEGPFTPIIFHSYVNAFSGKARTLVGRPSGNRGGVAWC